MSFAYPVDTTIHEPNGDTYTVQNRVQDTDTGRDYYYLRVDSKRTPGGVHHSLWETEKFERKFPPSEVEIERSVAGHKTDGPSSGGWTIDIPQSRVHDFENGTSSRY
ncbi:hypothetical protein [Halarchaeum nitratireducens]|uniref:Uncharacterized protein n=1 Tax=Halarchaeum nitratireducens TaxID=489913 RepID=A0A830GCM7_9EURY|nr:hypothetical protein [Halarchaeum nitratireducens]GGN18549.1 hypothetical protein GCM10009021_19430 [Halarchaeum nitratireducens]